MVSFRGARSANPESPDVQSHIRGSPALRALRNRGLLSAFVRSFARGDLFDQIDNAASKLGIGDARERAG